MQVVANISENIPRCIIIQRTNVHWCQGHPSQEKKSPNSNIEIRDCDFELLIAHSCVSRSGLISISPPSNKDRGYQSILLFHLQLTHRFLPRAVSGPAPEFGLSHEVLAASVWWNSVASLAETSGHRSVEFVSALHRSLGIWMSMGVRLQLLFPELIHHQCEQVTSLWQKQTCCFAFAVMKTSHIWIWMSCQTTRTWYDAEDTRKWTLVLLPKCVIRLL